MKSDSYGQIYVDEQDLVQQLYVNPDLNLLEFLVEDPEQYNHSVKQLHLDLGALTKYYPPDIGIEEFDQKNQKNWYMPEYYQNLDIAKWVLDQCQNQEELQRCGQELLLFQERNLFGLLGYLKYLVDIMRDNGIVWGVGRGSSTASFVLYLIGVHKINSIYYDLNINEFLK